MRISKLFITGVLGAALGACSQDVIEGRTDDSQYPVALYNEIVQEVVTRVNDEGFCNGDGVGIYVVNYNAGAPGTLALEGNQADNVKYTYEETTGKWKPAENVYYRDKVTPVDIYGYYPYSAPSSIDAYPFELAKDQSTDAANGNLGGYEASDFLWGKTENVAPTSQRINVKFQHRMAGVNVTLTEGTGFPEGEWTKLDKSVLLTNTIRKATVHLATGEVTPAGEAPTTGTVPYKKGGDFRAVVVPQSVAASVALFSITVDGTPYVFRKDETFTYVSGKLHKFTIEVSKKSGSGLEFKLLGESISAWEADHVSHDGTAREYIVIDSPEAGKLKEYITASGKDYAKVKNLKITGNINEADFTFMREQMSLLQSLNLKEVTIASNKIPNSAFAEKSSLVRFVFPDKLTGIGSNAFQRTNLAGSLIIPEGVVEIGEGAFMEVPFTGTLTFPKSLKKIERNVFYRCSGITGSFQFPETLRFIGNSAFYECKGIYGQLKLPENLDTLGTYAFYGCKGLTGSLTIPSKINKIGSATFAYCEGLNGELTLPQNLTEIEDAAFVDCKFRGVLVLPDNLVKIGENAFQSCNFSGELKFPQSLMIIGNSAFQRNGRLSGTLEFPEEMISIALSAFESCPLIEKLVIPKNMEAIQEKAFSGCLQLNSIVCKAVTPPRLSASAFNEVGKDNFTVEVPEASVADYSTAPGWNEFKRFAAHRDFSVSRNLLRTLNARTSKSFVLRALSDAAWSVEEKPDWVTVTPASGTGKAEVTVTVDERGQGAGNREGEIVFLLDGKDYRTRMKVEQYDYEHGDGDVLTVQRATKGSGVNLVFMGDCFDAKSISDGKYLDGINEAIGYFFAVEPYKTYKNYFNVHIVFGCSADDGIGTVNTIRESKFGSAYALGKVAPDEKTCFEYARKAPINDNVSNALITLILNTEDYGGVTYLWGDGSAIACCPMTKDYYPYDFRGLVQHEAGGHGFGKLVDEYIYHNDFIQTCQCLCCPHVDEFNDNKAKGWGANLSLTGNMHDVPWSHLIFDPQYSNVVDIYEGGYMHTRGVFRSEPNSCMNNNIPYFSAISREAIVKYIKQYAGEPYSFEDFKANDRSTSATLESRAAVSGKQYPASNKQHSPVYMGNKPEFEKSNR